MVRVLGLVIKYVKILRRLVLNKRNLKSSPTIQLEVKEVITHLTNKEIAEAENYFWHKGTEEVKQFVKAEKYKHLSTEVNGILVYTGRILPSDQINIITPMTSFMKDLHDTTFCAPVIYKHSPLAYAIINEIHWYNKSVKHSGIEATLRYSMKQAFIIEGREVAKRIKQMCNFFRYIEK